MKIVYCIASVYNPGGMERVLLNKLRWWVGRGGCELLVVTTDQAGRPPFYAFPEQVRMTDLGIGYSADNGRHPVAKIFSYFRKRRLHRRRLSELLYREKADIVVSLYPSESSFIPDIKDGSRKVLELHYCKFFRLQYGRRGLLGLADRFRTWQDGRIVRRFDSFVVLTQQDAGFWGALPNLSVIPNAALAAPAAEHREGTRRVIAVGRLDYQKGFDRLISAWAMLPEPCRSSWRLDIFGQGEWRERLQAQIDGLGLARTVRLNAPTKRIMEEYAESEFLVMSSHYEGFPMVMIEAMSCGLPVVSFDFLCGPADIIRPEENGLIVPDGDVKGLSDAMLRLMEDSSALHRMSLAARRVSETYSENAIMTRWERLFNDIMQ